MIKFASLFFQLFRSEIEFIFPLGYENCFYSRQLLARNPELYTPLPSSTPPIKMSCMDSCIIKVLSLINLFFIFVFRWLCGSFHGCWWCKRLDKLLIVTDWWKIYQRSIWRLQIHSLPTVSKVNSYIICFNFTSVLRITAQHNLT